MNIKGQIPSQFRKPFCSILLLVKGRFFVLGVSQASGSSGCYVLLAWLGFQFFTHKFSRMFGPSENGQAIAQPLGDQIGVNHWRYMGLYSI